MKIIGINCLAIFILLSVMVYPLKPEINLREREVRLRWYGVYKDYTVYIDDNREFSSPIVVKTERRDYRVELEPGVYFWKIRARGISSFVKKLKIDSAVSIKVRNDSLENDGNVELNVTLEKVTGAVTAELPYKGEIKVDDNSNITAQQK